LQTVRICYRVAEEDPATVSKREALSVPRKILEVFGQDRCFRQPLDPLVMVARRTGYSCCVVNTTARNQKRLPALYNAYDCDGFLTQHQLILVHCRLLSFKIRDLLSQESIGSSIFSKEVSKSSSSVNIRKTRLFIERVLQLNHQIRGGRDSRLRVSSD